MTRKTSIRDLRKNLKAHIEGQTAILIGTDYHARAILVPIPLAAEDRWDRGKKRAAIAKAKRLFKDAIAEATE